MRRDGDLTTLAPPFFRQFLNRYIVDFGRQGENRLVRAVYCGMQREYVLHVPRPSDRQSGPFRPRQQSTVMRRSSNAVDFQPNRESREEAVMPKLIKAREPQDARAERRIRRLARSRLGPRDGVLRARMVALSWDGHRVPDIAVALGCHPKTVRARLARFDAGGVEGLRDQARVPAGSARPSAAGSSAWSPRTRPAAWSRAATTGWVRPSGAVNVPHPAAVSRRCDWRACAASGRTASRGRGVPAPARPPSARRSSRGPGSIPRCAG